MSRNISIIALLLLTTAILVVFFLLPERIDDPAGTYESPFMTTPEMTPPEPEPTSLNVPEKPVEAVEKPGIRPFGSVTIAPDIVLDGKGTNIDSPEFWEAPNPEDTLLLVSAKGNDLIEIWKYPFTGNEQSPIRIGSRPNGLDIDQDRDLLLVGDSDERSVRIHSLPSGKHLKTIGKDSIGSGETNIDVLDRNGEKWVFVSEEHAIRAFDLDTGKERSVIRPKVESIEELLADSFSQTLHVPDEAGIASDVIRGGGISVYDPDGNPTPSATSNIYGNAGIFSGDAEGITAYICTSSSGADTGNGLIIVADQATGKENGFEFFDRRTRVHQGTLHLTGVSGTDGIASTGQPFPDSPYGLFAASDRDSGIAIVSWKKIFDMTGFPCEK